MAGRDEASPPTGGEASAGVACADLKACTDGTPSAANAASHGVYSTQGGQVTQIDGGGAASKAGYSNLATPSGAAPAHRPVKGSGQTHDSYPSDGTAVVSAAILLPEGASPPAAASSVQPSPSSTPLACWSTQLMETGQRALLFPVYPVMMMRETILRRGTELDSMFERVVGSPRFGALLVIPASSSMTADMPLWGEDTAFWAPGGHAAVLKAFLQEGTPVTTAEAAADSASSSCSAGCDMVADSDASSDLVLKAFLAVCIAANRVCWANGLWSWDGRVTAAQMGHKHVLTGLADLAGSCHDASRASGGADGGRRAARVDSAVLVHAGLACTVGSLRGADAGSGAAAMAAVRRRWQEIAAVVAGPKARLDARLCIDAACKCHRVLAIPALAALELAVTDCEASSPLAELGNALRDSSQSWERFTRAQCKFLVLGTPVAVEALQGLSVCPATTKLEDFRCRGWSLLVACKRASAKWGGSSKAFRRKPDLGYYYDSGTDSGSSEEDTSDDESDGMPEPDEPNDDDELVDDVPDDEEYTDGEEDVSLDDDSDGSDDHSLPPSDNSSDTHPSDSSAGHPATPLPSQADLAAEHGRSAGEPAGHADTHGSSDAPQVSMDDLDSAGRGAESDEPAATSESAGSGRGWHGDSDLEDDSDDGSAYSDELEAEQAATTAILPAAAAPGGLRAPEVVDLRVALELSRRGAGWSAGKTPAQVAEWVLMQSWELVRDGLVLPLGATVRSSAAATSAGKRAATAGGAWKWPSAGEAMLFAAEVRAVAGCIAAEAAADRPPVLVTGALTSAMVAWPLAGLLAVGDGVATSEVAAAACEALGSSFAECSTSCFQVSSARYVGEADDSGIVLRAAACKVLKSQMWATQRFGVGTMLRAFVRACRDDSLADARDHILEALAQATDRTRLAAARSSGNASFLGFCIRRKAWRFGASPPFRVGHGDDVVTVQLPQVVLRTEDVGMDAEGVAELLQSVLTKCRRNHHMARVFSLLANMQGTRVTAATAGIGADSDSGSTHEWCAADSHLHAVCRSACALFTEDAFRFCSSLHLRAGLLRHVAHTAGALCVGTLDVSGKPHSRAGGASPAAGERSAMLESTAVFVAGLHSMCMHMSGAYTPVLVFNHPDSRDVGRPQSAGVDEQDDDEPLDMLRVWRRGAGRLLRGGHRARGAVETAQTAGLLGPTDLAMAARFAVLASKLCHLPTDPAAKGDGATTPVEVAVEGALASHSEVAAAPLASTDWSGGNLPDGGLMALLEAAGVARLPELVASVAQFVPDSAHTDDTNLTVRFLPVFRIHQFLLGMAHGTKQAVAASQAALALCDALRDAIPGLAAEPSGPTGALAATSGSGLSVVAGASTGLSKAARKRAKRKAAAAAPPAMPIPEGTDVQALLESATAMVEAAAMTRLGWAAMQHNLDNFQPCVTIRLPRGRPTTPAVRSTLHGLAPLLFPPQGPDCPAPLLDGLLPLLTRLLAVPGLGLYGDRGDFVPLVPGLVDRTVLAAFMDPAASVDESLVLAAAGVTASGWGEARRHSLVEHFELPCPAEEGGCFGSADFEENDVTAVLDMMGRQPDMLAAWVPSAPLIRRLLHACSVPLLTPWTPGLAAVRFLLDVPGMSTPQLRRQLLALTLCDDDDRDEDGSLALPRTETKPASNHALLEANIREPLEALINAERCGDLRGSITTQVDAVGAIGPGPLRHSLSLLAARCVAPRLPWPSTVSREMRDIPKHLVLPLFVQREGSDCVAPRSLSTLSQQQDPEEHRRPCSAADDDTDDSSILLGWHSPEVVFADRDDANSLLTSGRLAARAVGRVLGLMTARGASASLRLSRGMCYFLLYGRNWLARAAADDNAEGTTLAAEETTLPAAAVASGAGADDTPGAASEGPVPVEVAAALRLLEEVDPTLASSLRVLATADPSSDEGTALLVDAMDFSFAIPVPPALPELPSGVTEKASRGRKRRGQQNRHPPQPAPLAAKTAVDDGGVGGAAQAAATVATAGGPAAASSAVPTSASTTVNLLSGLIDESGSLDGITLDASNRFVYVVLAASAVLLGDGAAGLPRSMERLLPAPARSKLALEEAVAAGGLAQYLRAGFDDVVPLALRRLLRAEDLYASLGQAPPITTADLRAATSCKGAENVLRWFWEVVEEFSDAQRSQLLKFWTAVHGGSISNLPREDDDPPLALVVQSALVEDAASAPAFAASGLASGAGGVDAAEPEVAVRLRLPGASTCAMQLKLPRYGSKEVLRRSLEFALSHAADQFAFL